MTLDGASIEVPDVREERFDPGTPFPSERVIAEDMIWLSDGDGENDDDAGFARLFSRGADAATRPRKS